MSANPPQMIEFEAAYVRDGMAKQKEPYQRPYEFLYTGRAPAVGQRTETQLTARTNGSWCLLSGIVTEVGELPTFDMWITVSSAQVASTDCLETGTEFSTFVFDHARQQ